MQTAKEIHAPSNIGMNNLPRIVGTHRNGKRKYLTKHGLVFGDPFKEDRKHIRKFFGGFKPEFKDKKARKEAKGKRPNIIQRGFNRVINFFRNQNR